MTFKFENKELKIKGKSIEFDDQIKEVIESDRFLVVRSDYFESNTNENVFGLNADGKIE